MNATDARLNRLSGICADVAQVCLASIVIPFLFEKFDLIVLLWGSATTLTFWFLSLLFAGSKR